MRIGTLLSVVAFAALASSVVGQSSVVTFSKKELGSAVAGLCNSQFLPRGATHVHRNLAGNMIYIVAEGEREAIIFAGSQSCNTLSSDTLDLWRSDANGSVVAQSATRFGDKRLLVGTEGDGIAGRRFDIERSGTYLIISHGDSSSVASVAKPYRRLAELNFDAQRIFLRRNGLFVVGNNTATRQLESSQIRNDGGVLTAEPPMPVGGMPSGVRVLDYNEARDELLLGGLDASGQTSFVVLDLATGQGAPVPNAKPGDETGLFISDGALRARLTSGNLAQPQAAPVPSQATQPAGQPQQQRRRGLMGIFGRRGEE